MMNEVFKALSDPNRRALLDRLYEDNGLTLSELSEHLDMSRQGVTNHLDILEKANLIVTVWRGRKKLHYLNPAPIHEIYERWIHKYERHHVKALNELKKVMEKDKNKEQR